MKSNKEKCKKLEEKIGKLVEKLEEEIGKLQEKKSSVKRLSYMIKCKMLLNKIERQQELLKAKKQFEKQREDNKFTKMEERVATRNKIIELNKDIKALEKKLNKNKQYDFNSESFMLPIEDVENSGGIEQYTDELEESGNPDQIKTAEKIRRTIEHRRALEEAKKDLKEQKEQLAEMNFDLKIEDRLLSRKEMLVTAKSKFNIFAKARNFVSSIWGGIKEFREGAKESKGIDKGRLKDYAKLESNYEQKKEQIRKEYEQKMHALDCAYNSVEKAIYTKHENKKATIRNKQASKFQEELQNMAKIGNEQQLDGTENGDEVEQEERNESTANQNHNTNEEVEVCEGEVVPTQDDEEIGG